MAESCGACRTIDAIEGGESENAVARLPTGYVVLGHVQYHRGYTMFVSRWCVAELHELGDARGDHLRDMALVAEAVFRAFNPVKLNYEALGNSVRHLHWHLFPRAADDPHPHGPVWRDDAFMKLFNQSGHSPADVDLDDARRDVLAALTDLGANVEMAYLDR